MIPAGQLGRRGAGAAGRWSARAHGVYILNLCAVGEIAGVAETGDDIAFCREFVIDGAAPYFAIGFAAEDEFDADRAGDRRDDMDLGGMAFLTEILDGLYEGGAGGEHGIGDDDDAPSSSGQET